ncbi:hypothetical protein [Brucella sp. NBRC 12953]|uniref:hypothetical protein n=1 Tax=Brucella sp. NBRC 12953 TaxID=3075481 RepID=UPI00333ED974
MVGCGPVGVMETLQSGLTATALGAVMGKDLKAGQTLLQRYLATVATDPWGGTRSLSTASGHK